MRLDSCCYPPALLRQQSSTSCTASRSQRSLLLQVDQAASEATGAFPSPACQLADQHRCNHGLQDRILSHKMKLLPGLVAPSHPDQKLDQSQVQAGGQSSVAYTRAHAPQPSETPPVQPLQHETPSAVPTPSAAAEQAPAALSNLPDAAVPVPQEAMPG